jgi:hypothetical protein
MKEFVDFRIPEERAKQYLEPQDGTTLGGTVRKLVLSVDDPRYDKIGKLERKFLRDGQPFFLGWQIKRHYAKKELEAAEIFNLDINAVFEPSGEECGTEYNASEACLICGAGRKQVSDLILDLRKVPKSKEIAQTIADEWIVSQRLAELLIDSGMTGFELRSTRHKAHYRDAPIDPYLTPTGREIMHLAKEAGFKTTDWDFYVWLNRPEQRHLLERESEEFIQLMERRNLHRSKLMPVWYQLIITSEPIQTIPPTLFGNNPFDEDPEGEYRCPLGHVSGLNLLSEIWVSKDSWDGSDIVRTQDLVGIRRGVLVPRPLLLISSRMWQLLTMEKIKGYKIEIAHLA